jgi:HSP20 family protein
MTVIRFFCQTIEEHKMNTDLKKWNPFKFLRGSGRKPGTDSPQSPADGEPSRVGWPDIPRLFSRDPWRAMEDFLHDPFAARGALERWFGDFSSSRFQPRIDVVDEGKILRVSVELPGMEREDLTISVEDGALVLRGEKSRTCTVRKTAAIALSARTGPLRVRSQCRKTPIPTTLSQSLTRACLR